MLSRYKGQILTFPGWVQLYFLLSLFLWGCTTKNKPVSLSEKNLPADVRVLDERLELSVFAEDTSIVTPIGIAIDSLNRIFVLESHTHLPPKDYQGPASDRIKIFTDENGDGHPDQVSVFAEGLTEGLNMAFSPDGLLYVVTSKAVWVLFDHNGDGKRDEQVEVIRLTEPEKVYAHAALLSITFSHDGWMYISRGNTGGAAWKMVGTDSSSVSGYGDGGNIVRARPDGTQLEEVATGFWNPVDLKFDEKGRLLAADNDPDSRGPNRLVHVVKGGDFGYQSLYGGSGIHPYLAWNGELPGTLPYAVGLGEAPSGLLDASTTALPSDYRGEMLCTIWEESRIVRVKFSPKGVSLGGSTQVIIEGNEQFRPVAFAADKYGTIYFTDWVLRDYPNHGKGRIWKLSPKKEVAVQKPRKLYAPPLPDPEGKALEELYSTHTIESFPILLNALQPKDPFLRHAATIQLAQPVYRQQVLKATIHTDPQVRLGAMLALQGSGDKQNNYIAGKLLTDPDVQVRQMALQWIGKAGLTEFKSSINKALTVGEVTPALFETYLETVSHLDPAFIQAYKSKSEAYAKSIERTLPPMFIENFVADQSEPASLRALAVRYLKQRDQQMKLLTSILAKEKEANLLLETIRSLASLPDEKVAVQLLKVAQESAYSPLVRAEALLALHRQPTDASAQVVLLLDDPDTDVQIEAVRYLMTRTSSGSVKQVLEQKLVSINSNTNTPLGEQITRALSKQETKRPSNLEEWQTLLADGGDPERGRRVFFSTQAMCAMCHAVSGRGGDLGPDLSDTGQSKSRAQLIHSILRPSEEISPEYQGWFIKLRNGEIHQGRQIDIGTDAIELYTPTQVFVTFDKMDIADYGQAQRSLMPDGLENNLTVSDLRDLIAFLEGKQKSKSVLSQ